MKRHSSPFGWKIKFAGRQRVLMDQYFLKQSRKLVTVDCCQFWDTHGLKVTGAKFASWFTMFQNGSKLAIFGWGSGPVLSSRNNLGVGSNSNTRSKLSKVWLTVGLLTSLKVYNYPQTVCAWSGVSLIGSWKNRWNLSKFCSFCPQRPESLYSSIQLAINFESTPRRLFPT